MAKETISLSYDNCVEIINQFESAFPAIRQRKDFLAMGVNKEGNSLLLKITLMHPGVKNEPTVLKLPKDFDVIIEQKEVSVKIFVQIAPVLPNASPKSKKTFES